MTRLVRMLKIVKERNKLVKYLNEILKIGVGFERLLFFILIFFILSHIVCCFWIFSARLEDFGPDTWVVRYGYQDLSNMDLYIASFYFTITTITTVGFGDISGGTTMERIICILLMVAGVISFSFATGTLSSIIANFDSSKAKLKEKMGILNDIRKEYGVGSKLYDELRQAIKFDHVRNINSTVNFINELPYRLRIELAAKIHTKIMQNIKFFNNRPKDFIAMIGPMLRPVRVNEGQYVYRSGEPVLEIYFMSKGQAAFVVPQKENVPFVLVEEGDMFGIIDLVPDTRKATIEKEVTRNFTVLALDYCELLCL